MLIDFLVRKIYKTRLTSQLVSFVVFSRLTLICVTIIIICRRQYYIF